MEIKFRFCFQFSLPLFTSAGNVHVLTVCLDWWSRCGSDHQCEVTAGHTLTSECFSRPCDSQGSDTGRLAPPAMHYKPWRSQYSSHLSFLSVIYSVSLWEISVSLQYRRMHTDSPESLPSYELKYVEIWCHERQFCSNGNVIVVHDFTDWSGAECSVLMLSYKHTR